MNNSKSVLHKIASLYADQLMSDICLVVGDNRYPAHRVILCASSEVFQVMLMNDCWSECREKVIELKEDPSCSLVFPQFLRYLYVGQIRISLHTALPLLALADKYDIKDLVQLCVDYMLKHVAKAAANGFLVPWLEYTVRFSPYHQELTDALQKFLKYNLEIVTESKEFLDLDVNILIVLLQQNDLVLESEFTLFGYIEKWLLNKKEQIESESLLDDAEKRSHLLQIIEAVVSHIRFPMMTPTELSKLLLRDFISVHQEYFVSRIAIAMSYHSGQIERVAENEFQQSEGLLFTPRLYKTDIWGLSMRIPNFDTFEDYQSFAGNFFSQSNLSECQEGE
jgi:BTB/POZ domain-containing protein 17